METIKRGELPEGTPEWVQWVAMDKNGAWWGYQGQPWVPSVEQSLWHCGREDSRPAHAFGLIPSVLYPCSDWRQSLRQVVADAGDGWVEWHGGECPLEVGDKYEVKFRGSHLTSTVGV